MADSPEVLQGYLEKAELVARKASEIVDEALSKGERRDASIKGINTSDLVTETDLAVEKFVFEELRNYYPDHKFIGEESVSSGGGSCTLTDTPTWIIDPIDGTSNFVHGFPFSVISIGLAVNKELVVGVAYNFFQRQMYTARKGGGAFLNGKRISVSNVTELNKSIVITDYGSTRQDFEFIPKVEMMKALAGDPGHVHGIRTLGSAVASLCMVASGRAEAYFEYGVHCWDIAAGAVIVREAGGIAIYPTGSELDIMGRGILVAANVELAKSIVPILKHIDYPRD
ncbi:PREDICTED: inositol monophosphatase 1-like [Amphimedon queenslandica]|uniref:Inositol-1-monophosphatase n=1 Tax=Amphimedon queenslandica TaxID=400682 RepID=A0A1X7VXP2_AMPQE|nr:PREDICTED: inositol monophosphatase 1-like [Amphimedon queenslandica]|eukprot:XP_003382455.1 PREDICTED: inositol monophosphatase 1-like [Amphimedon queenslandica]